MDMLTMTARQPGPPHVLTPERQQLGGPAAGHVLLRLDAIGVNFVDTQHRAGTPYPVTWPLIPGIEAAGTVEALGENVDGHRPGDRVAVAGPMCALYAQFASVPADRLIPLPDGVSTVQAAAILLQGMTAHMLIETVGAVQAGQTVLVLGAAGGVALNAVQLARRRGATVIGTASSPAKAELARRAGAHHVLTGDPADLLDAVNELTGGRGVDLLLDGIGGTAFQPALRLLATGGHLVSFGQSAGPVAPFDPAQLSGLSGAGNRGSLRLSWPTLSDHTRSRADLLWRAGEVLNWVAQGELQVHVDREYPLDQAARAHERLERREALGKLLLRP